MQNIYGKTIYQTIDLIVKELLSIVEKDDEKILK